MAIIKKFRIKSFKQKKSILKLQNLSLSFQKDKYLKTLVLRLTKVKFLECLGQMVLVNQLYLTWLLA